ncbi:protein kinase domain-containing protein [Haematococcus lacustris]|uniref:Protein kinase domain-containing protein n=1 Tax=Haematococcus lacustris TaxID=44745 RepID=A0A699YQE4_HAELA|nr:protein kinase domain-containing protein [Haematococcus lacustris]
MGLTASDGFTTLRDKHSTNEITLKQLRTIKVLGEGAFATVELCEYTATPGDCSRMVAVKKLKPAALASPEDLKSFQTEVALMRKLKHKGIVEYVGIGCADSSSEAAKKASMYMVQEFMGGGTLKKMVIHRDLKMDNVLLTEGEVSVKSAKLSDFGLVAFQHRRPSLLRASTCMTPGVPTKTWGLALARMSTMAGVKDASVKGGDLFSPQTLKVSHCLSGQTGTLMYELFHRYLMLHAISLEGTDEEVEAYAERVSNGFRPPIAPHLGPEFQSLLQQCWAQDPATRPRMDQVVQRLRQLQLEGLMGPGTEPQGCQCAIC